MHHSCHSTPSAHTIAVSRRTLHTHEPASTTDLTHKTNVTSPSSALSTTSSSTLNQLRGTVDSNLSQPCGHTHLHHREEHLCDSRDRPITYKQGPANYVPVETGQSRTAVTGCTMSQSINAVVISDTAPVLRVPLTACRHQTTHHATQANNKIREILKSKQICDKISLHPIFPQQTSPS